MKYPNIQVSKGMAGWFAVMIWWNPTLGGFAEPYTIGDGRYAMQTDAIAEAERWSEETGLPFYPPRMLDEQTARQDVEQQIKELFPNIEITRLK